MPIRLCRVGLLCCAKTGKPACARRAHMAAAERKVAPQLPMRLSLLLCSGRFYIHDSMSHFVYRTLSDGWKAVVDGTGT